MSVASVRHSISKGTEKGRRIVKDSLIVGQKVPTVCLMSKRVELSVKSVIVGDSGVGKTCLLTRFVHSTFQDSAQPTLGVEFMSHILDTPRRRLELQLWDTAGQELFRSVTRGYYRNAAVAYIVFDLTNRASFTSVDRWLKDIHDVADKDVIIVLIGNKSDAVDDREIPADEAQKYALDHHLTYFETSAKTGTNIAEAIQSCVPALDERADKGRSFSPVDSLISTPEPASASCC
jgi:small GTP-binding protein